MTNHIENETPYLHPQFVDLHQYINIEFSRLPHWHQTKKVLFSTFRMADSVPIVAINEYYRLQCEWKRTHSNVEGNTYPNTIWTQTEEWMERWCNKGHGSCLLADINIRKMVTDTIWYKSEKQLFVYAFVVMPNHVHILYTLLEETKTRSDNFIRNIKRYTARIINKQLGRSGAFWQKESFDRLVRSENDFHRYLNYIIHNPNGLSPDKYTLYIDPHLARE